MSDLELEDIGAILGDEDLSRLLIRGKVGEASDEEDLGYTMELNLDYSMVIRSKKTGRVFILSWRDAINLAIHKGINKDPADS